MGRDDKYQQFEFADTTPEKSWQVPWKWIGVVILAGVAGAAAWLWTFERPRVAHALQGTPLEALAAPPAPPAATRAYKWRDADGTWNITDRPPPGGIAYEVLR